MAAFDVDIAVAEHEQSEDAKSNQAAKMALSLVVIRTSYEVFWELERK